MGKRALSLLTVSGLVVTLVVVVAGGRQLETRFPGQRRNSDGPPATSLQFHLASHHPPGEIVLAQSAVSVPAPPDVDRSGQAWGILMNEIFANPKDGDLTYDANGDGSADSYDDEFVELVNCTGEAVDVAGWSLHDSVRERFRFGEDEPIPIEPGEIVSVFGGGDPSTFCLPGRTFVCDSRLALNNSGDKVTLLTATGDTADAYQYDDLGDRRESIICVPDCSGDWVRPGDLGYSWIFSPNRSNESELLTDQTTWGRIKAMYRNGK